MSKSFQKASDEQLIESLKSTLSNTQLNDEQQALFQELARRVTSYSKLQTTVKQQSQQLTEQEQKVQHMQHEHTQLSSNMLQMQQNLQQQLQDQQAVLSSLQTAQQASQQAALASASTTNPQTSTVSQPTGPRIKPEKPPKYNGSSKNLNNWLFMMDGYFRALQLTNSYEKVDFAATMLEDKALTWWRSALARKTLVIGNVGWDEFKLKLEGQFRDHDQEYQLRRKLQTLKQHKSVDQYITNFRNIITELGQDAPDGKTQYYDFLAGLKVEIKKEVLLNRPTSLEQAMVMAARADNVFYVMQHPVERKDTRGTPMELGNVVNNGKKRTNTPNRVNINHTTKQGKTPVECWYCGKRGHYQSECYKKQRDQKGTAGHTPRGKNKLPFHKNKFSKGKQLYNAEYTTDADDDGFGYVSDTSTSSKN